MGPLGLRIRDGGVQGLTSGNADGGGLVGRSHGKVEGGREAVVPPWHINVGRAAGRLLLLTGACREQEARLFQLRIVYGGFVVTKLKNLVADAIVPDGSVPPAEH